MFDYLKMFILFYVLIILLNGLISSDYAFIDLHYLKYFFYSICVYLLRYSSHTGSWSILFADTMHTKFCSSLIICLTRATAGKYTSMY